MHKHVSPHDVFLIVRVAGLYALGLIVGMYVAAMRIQARDDTGIIVAMLMVAAACVIVGGLLLP